MRNVPLTPPENIAIVRFSALGDVVLALPLLRGLQRTFPHAAITWITSPLGYDLLGKVEGVSFAVYDKPRAFADYRNFYRSFGNRKFDAVLALQANLRINMLYPALHAPRKIGFDRMRAREGQWLVSNQQVDYTGPHRLDSFVALGAAWGVESHPPEWNLTLSEEDRTFAATTLANLPRPILALHPVSSKAERNWPFERYAETVTSARERWGGSFVFTGGNSPLEREYCARLAGIGGIDLSGRTTPRQLAAVLERVDGVIAPDTAAVHLARAMDTPVIGLYAVASPELSGPYGRMEYVVNRYPDAVRQFLGKDPDNVPWNTRVHHPDAMRLITVEDVLSRLDRLL